MIVSHSSFRFISQKLSSKCFYYIQALTVSVNYILQCFLIFFVAQLTFIIESLVHCVDSFRTALICIRQSVFRFVEISIGSFTHNLCLKISLLRENIDLSL